jgi:superfamily II DNA or RNA helicase
MTPGTIVRCRNRDWILLPGNDEVYLLRPLAGGTDDVVAVHRELSTLVSYDLAEEFVRPSSFPLPTEQDLTDATGAHLLWQAARLTLREGATPFRSLGRISIRPRTYQFVPLLMALRLDPVRLFLADDVGVGKTIEALLVARELLDRSEIRRFSVLCPPYLCEQWEKEIREKFNLDAVVVRSGTIGRLERGIPAGRSIYQYYPIQVISIDWVKSDRNKHQFLHFCPELVIVDEVHGAAEASADRSSQQERHQLLREIAQHDRRHLILLTATPHSGIEEAFRSLLGLLKPEFREWKVSELSETQRIELARHFVQRTRRDIEHDWEDERCFPDREASDDTYELSPAYRQLFQSTYAFCSEIVRTGEQLEERKRRVRYWGALALLRCVMSSPASAQAALEKRFDRAEPAGEEAPDSWADLTDSQDWQPDDETPVPSVSAVERTLEEGDKRRLRELARLAEALQASSADTKLSRCIEVVRRLLREGFHPVVWCRFVATAEYVADGLREALPRDVQVVCVTGRLGDDERRLKIQQIAAERPRVLVATDCLSEGINLQDKFTAVLHYDLPWNPNRLEQREGRVDRYGQTARVVKAVRFYGRDNPVDGIVIRVLLDKARQIHRTLGTYVPVPQESDSVMQALLNALFLRAHAAPDPQQLELFEIEHVTNLHRRWEADAEREKISRTRFAQRALKPEEVRRELEATDDVLGDPDAVREFTLAAGQRLGLPISPDRRLEGVFRISLSPAATNRLPELVRAALPETNNADWRVSFVSPTPEGAEYLGRNHPFVAALARFLLEEALTKPGKATASRCGVVRTRAVSRLTNLLLLRPRYLIEQPEKPPLLSEEVLVVGYELGPAGAPRWLPHGEALRLLATARPDANIAMAEKHELLKATLDQIGPWTEPSPTSRPRNAIEAAVRDYVLRRAGELEGTHKRIRRAVDMRVRELAVRPQLPPDLLGVLILQPVVQP